jgi:hypothetical protein
MHVDPLLGSDREISCYYKAVARYSQCKQSVLLGTDHNRIVRNNRTNGIAVFCAFRAEAI